MQIAQMRNPSCKVQPVKTKVSSECRSRSKDPEESNWRILLALEFAAITEHPPSNLRENSKIISGASRSSRFILCLISSLVSCLVLCLVSRLVSCFILCLEIARIPKNCWQKRRDEDKNRCENQRRNHAQSLPGGSPGHPKLMENRSQEPPGTPRAAQ